jgi:hypothetical protein
VTRAIITAAGEARRWKNYTGVPKHLAVIEGETLLRRLTRQLRERGIEAVVIVSPPDDGRYQTEGARLHPRAMNPRWRKADRYMSTELWNPDGRTLYVPGDLYATDAAMDTMVDEPNRTWVWYLRLRRYGWHGWERSRAVFGLGFWPEDHQFFRRTVKEVVRQENDPRSPVRRALGIDLYRAMAGETPAQYSRTHGSRRVTGHRQIDGLNDGVFQEYPPHTVCIEDDTTDLDHPEHYDHLLRVLRESAA